MAAKKDSTNEQGMVMSYLTDWKTWVFFTILIAGIYAYMNWDSLKARWEVYRLAAGKPAKEESNTKDGEVKDL